jgi:hypothetical protein
MRGAAARRARGRVVALALVLVLALVLGGPGLCAASAGGRTASPPAQPDDAEIDRFAAACVATEPLRKARDREIWKRSNPVSYLWLRATRGKQVAKWMSSPLMNQECREAYVDYISQTGRIIDSCNLTVCRFNDVSLAACLPWCPPLAFVSPTNIPPRPTNPLQLSRYVRADKNVRHKTMRRIRLLKELEREEDELKSELLRELSVLEDATAATTTEEETEPKDLAAQESDGGMWELVSCCFHCLVSTMCTKVHSAYSHKCSYAPPRRNHLQYHRALSFLLRQRRW